MAPAARAPYPAGMSADPVPLPDPVAAWRAGIEAISPHAAPCRYLTPARWAAMREAALDFCDRFGGEAHRLGWTAEALFGVHPVHGTLRVDYCGALMLGGDRAEGVAVDRVLFARTAAYRNKPGQVWGVPVWVFARRGAH